MIERLERLERAPYTSRAASSARRNLSARPRPQVHVVDVAGRAVSQLIAGRDTFIPAGAWQLDEFLARGAGMPWAHGRLGEPLIGRATSIRAVPGIGLEVAAEIHADGLGGIADRLAHLARAGLPLPVSVGFESEAERPATKAEIARHGMHRIIERARLVELSFVDVAADPFAQVVLAELHKGADDDLVRDLAAAFAAESATSLALRMYQRRDDDAAAFYSALEAQLLENR